MSVLSVPIEFEQNFVAVSASCLNPCTVYGHAGTIDRCRFRMDVIYDANMRATKTRARTNAGDACPKR